MRLSIVSCLERLALQTAVFLIPANLAYHFHSEAAYINGRLVDYLLPKLYLSDLPIIFLLIIFLYKSRYSIDIKLLFKNKRFLLGLIFAIYLLFSSLASAFPQAGLWYTCKFIEFYLFGYYLIRHYSFPTLIRLIAPPLLFSLGLQTIIVIYQYIHHISLFGYFFLGQTNLAGIDVAKNSSRGYLEVIPYGTTPHPNVLAGFYALSTLLIYLRTTIFPKKIFKLSLNILLIGLFLLIFYLIGSISSLSGLLFAFFFYQLLKSISRQKYSLLLLAIAISTQLFSLILIQYFHQFPKWADNPSISNRYELIMASLTMIQTHPFSGVGPNQFVGHLPAFPLKGQQTYFLQPVHQGGLLIFSELGYLGFSLTMVALIAWINSSQANRARLTAYLPFIALISILSVDHYPLTLQTGQLLTTLSLVLPLLKPTLPE